MLSRSHFEKLPSVNHDFNTISCVVCATLKAGDSLMGYILISQIFTNSFVRLVPSLFPHSKRTTREDLEKFSRGSPGSRIYRPSSSQPESARSVYFWNSHRREVIMISPLFLHGLHLLWVEHLLWTARWVKHSVLFLTSNWSYLSRQRLPPTATRACSAAERTDSLIYHRVFSFF